MRRAAVVAVAVAAGMLAARADVTVTDGVLTIGGGTNLVVATEQGLKDLGEKVTSVVVDAATLTYDLAADQTLSLPYAFKNGAVFAVGPEGRTANVTGERFFQGSFGQSFVKRGAGRVYLTRAACGVVSKPTRFTVAEGVAQLINGDYFGNHATTTTNLTIAVGEGATWHCGVSHCAVGPIELTGGTWVGDNPSPSSGFWGDTSLKGGVTAHASATASKMYATSWFHLGQPNSAKPHATNCVFNVEEGATLYVYGDLWNGTANGTDALTYMLTKRGAGTLGLMGEGRWTGGTVIEGGKIVLGHAQALGTSPVTLLGDVEVAVAAGLTVTFPEVKGSGTITVSGKGGVTFPKKAATVTATDKAAEPFTAFADGVMTLTTLDNTLTVAEGTATLTDVVEAAEGLSRRADIRKRGAGTLVLGSGLRGKYRAIIVEEGAVEFADDSCFGSGGTGGTGDAGNVGGMTVAGGTIRPTKNYQQGSTRFTFTGEKSVIDVPQGVTFASVSNCFYSAGATVTKTGAGAWRLQGEYRTERANVAGTRWVIDEGRLYTWGGGTFGGHLTCWNGTIEIHENAEFYMDDKTGHQPLGPIVLRGGTLLAHIAQFKVADYATEGGTQWGGFSFNGGIKVLKSAKKSRVISRLCFVAHGSFSPTFEVEEGAVLEMNTELRRGRDAPYGLGTIDGNLTKTGAGTLRLLRPLSILGTFDICAGTVELAEGGYIDSAANVRVASEATLLLNDGTRFVSAADIVPSVVSEADVWMDATRIPVVADGTALETIANLGTAGGSFAKFPKAVSATGGVIPNAPKYVAEGKGIGGKASVGFDGTMALALDAYGNTGTNCEAFVVGVWTNFCGVGGQGRWGGVLSLGSTAMTQNEDQFNWGVLSGYFEGVANKSEFKSVSTIFGNESQDGAKGTTAYSTTYASVGITFSPTFAINVPFVMRMRRGDISGDVEFWRNDTTTQSATKTYSKRFCRIDRVALGTRLMTGGCATTYGESNKTKTRNLIGQIGEVLVFTKALTANERKQVNDYLRRKWVGTTAERPGGMTGAVTVETPAGAKAAFVANVANADSAGLTVTKRGAGEALLGGGSATLPFAVAVQEGTAALRQKALPSRVPVWLDADDAASVQTDEAGNVTNLVNKGFCGGSFVRAEGQGAELHYPTRTLAGLNGRATLTFDGAAAMVSDCYTNHASPRRLSVYAVQRRNLYKINTASSGGGGYGKWATPFTLIPYVEPCDNDHQDFSYLGGFHTEDNTETTLYADLGRDSTSRIATPPTGTAAIFVAHVTTNGFYLSFETNATPVTAVPRLANDRVWANEDGQIERIILAGRAVGHKVHYYGENKDANRCWFGDLAELVITTEPLTYDEEGALLGYLRKKWFDKGDGSATPPAFLAGQAAAPVSGESVAFAFADGTRLVSEADTVSVGSLETQGTVDWVRRWSGAREDAEAFALFEAEALSLGTIRLWAEPAVRACEVKVVGYGEKGAEPQWQVYRGARLRPAATIFDRNSAYWLRDETGLILFMK